MSDFQTFKEELLKDPEIRAAYKALKPETEVIRAMIDARPTGSLPEGAVDAGD